MKTATNRIKRQAQKKLLTLLNNQFPASQGDFFTIVKTANRTITKFYDEIVGNVYWMTPEQKQDYHLGLISIFENIKFKFNSADLDLILKNHGEDFSTFPHISNPDLREMLSLNIITMGAVEASKITNIEKVIEYKELQKECLWFYFSIKVREILKTLRREQKHQNPEFRYPLQHHAQTNTPFTTRYVEKQFFLILNENLNYLDATPTGFKDRHLLKEECEALLRRTKELKLATIEEVSDNLLQLSIESILSYLKRLLQDINKMISIFEEKEFYFLKNQDKVFLETTLNIHIENRQDIIDLLRHLNSNRLEMSKNLRRMIDLRIDLYQEIKTNDSISRKPLFTAKQCSYALDDVGFFELPKIKAQPKTKVSLFISALSGASAKNIKTGIEERHLRKGKNASARQKKDSEYVKAWFRENMDPE